MTRTFELHRDRDISGVSGTGIVADGCVWPDGAVSIRWRGDYPSTVSWNSVADAEHVHGHGGATRIVWAGAVPDRDCPACEAGIPHTEHCPTPETHNWGCGCPTDTARQDSVRTVPDTSRTPDTGKDIGHEFRDHLGVLLSRVRRGVQSPAEADLLAGHVEHLMRSLDQTAARVATLEHVAAGNKRHVQLIVPDLQRAEATLARVRAHLAELRRHQADAHPSERMECAMCGTDPADDLARALAGPAAGQVTDSSTTLPAAPTPEFIEQFARALAGAECLNPRRSTAAWGDLTDTHRDRYRQQARRICTPPVAHPSEEQQASGTEGVDESAAGRCGQHPGAPVIGGMCGGWTAYPADMR
ncbi:hypothetical protein ACIPXV_02925 [Streptomyces libani]|uniref:hypothetical protein n=1 Tax=Streptomyces nigrescens TaxID=1920 RepID=UPI003826F1DC